jgi:hypothetical protein
VITVGAVEELQQGLLVKAELKFNLEWRLPIPISIPGIEPGPRGPFPVCIRKEGGKLMLKPDLSLLIFDAPEADLSIVCHGEPLGTPDMTTGRQDILWKVDPTPINRTISVHGFSVDILNPGSSRPACNS